ncbi:hypothetical protein R1sor_022401 [Riccia sorocarpa]|uniref:Reverse transcriptase domain-containing protein n=1 Tax=Riccia sorocarpa TaxID=122646 RepID=A0ABD3GMX0_9MARC
MVLVQEDSAGPSPLLKGGPLEAWVIAELEWNLEDAYNYANRRSGPRFTRQVVRGGRLDQSRLDRVYFSNSASGFSKDALSDHNPVYVDINLLSSRRKKRLRGQLKVFRQEDRLKLLLSETLKKQELLQGLREKISQNSTEEELSEYNSLETSVHEAELLEASVSQDGAEILAARLKRILPGLVDDDQSGFVEGRHIMDNVLTLKLCLDLTNTTGEASVFCKLDFEKAFDRIQHDFLWDTLRKMNVCLKFIALANMLVANGKAKVHVNGLFTQTFQLRRGEKFNALKPLIATFEKITGAKLNLGKSVIIPMAMDRRPLWLEHTGCKILEAAEEITYLGRKVGTEVEDAQHERDLISKMSKRLSHWTTRFLSWPARIILAKHVIRAFPVYQLLGVGLPPSGFKKLETLCREFIWGRNGGRRAKLALIAWDWMTRQKENGGLGVRSFKDQADILKDSYITRLLQGESAE